MDIWKGEKTKNKKLKITLVISLALFMLASVFLYISKKSYSKSYPEVSSIQNLSIKQDLEVQLPKDSNLAAPPPSGPVKDMKILFIGDMMFDRYIRQVGEKKGYDYLFQGTDNLLKDNDLVVGNLEGPITDNKSISVESEFGARNNYIFTFDPQVAGVLKKHNINLVDLGNNHILNFNHDGLMQTEKYLNDLKVSYFCADESRTMNYKLSGLNISFVCYDQFESGGEQKTLNDIKTAKKKGDLVILYAHWGKEYETAPLEKTKVLAHEFIDAGADLIIGTHPHVIQAKEVYHGKTIYYSLGNFIFDQYFDPDATQGLAVKVIINPENKNLSFEEYKLKLKNSGQTQLEK